MKDVRCAFGRHIGQERGGTLMFTCPRCGGSYWQPHDFRSVTAAADLMIAAGHSDEALEYAQRAIRESYGALDRAGDEAMEEQRAQDRASAESDEFARRFKDEA